MSWIQIIEFHLTQRLQCISLTTKDKIQAVAAQVAALRAGNAEYLAGGSTKEWLVQLEVTEATAQTQLRTPGHVRPESSATLSIVF